MGIVINGTTIPENVANALNVNGINITSVIANSVAVWNQSLFNASFSGDSIAGFSSNSTRVGISTSAGLCRASMLVSGTQYYGIWLSINNNKTFSGGSSVASATELYASGSNTLSFKYNFSTSNYDTVTFINNVFYLTTDTPASYFNMEASGSSIRITSPQGFAGAWISLS